jgi:hypothetical protein
MRTNSRMARLCIAACIFVGVTSPTATNAETPRRAEIKSDPVVRATFFGKAGTDANLPIVAKDASGNVFLADWTQSTDLPVTPGSYAGAFAGDHDLFVAKFSPDMDTLLACTYLGGSSIEGDWPGIALQVSADNSVYICGTTGSWDFPTTPGCFQSLKMSGNDGFVARLSNDLTSLLASTYIGGNGDDAATAMAMAPDGSIIISGQTSSADFPHTAGAYDTTRNGSPADAFILRLDANLTAVQASTYLGGTSADYVEELRLGPQGQVYVAGWTSSTNFPVAASAFQTVYGGYQYDGFVSCLSGDFTQLLASTYLGGTSWDFVYALALDSSGRVIVAGHTASTTGFPTTPGAYDRTYNSTLGPDNGDDAFVTIFDSALTTVQASSYFGGQGWECGYGLLLYDSLILVGGSTSSANLPTTREAFDRSYNGGSLKYAGDAFVAAFTPSLSRLTSATFIGGQGTDNGHVLVLGSDGDVYFAGGTGSSDFPVTAGVFQSTYGGGSGTWGGDDFLCRISGSCYVDSDGDGVPDQIDNCVTTANPLQEDSDSDGIGDACCCIGLTGNIDGDPSDIVDISDLSAMVDYLFFSGTISGCPNENDVDASASVDISDLSIVVDFLFFGGTLPTCP